MPRFYKNYDSRVTFETASSTTTSSCPSLSLEVLWIPCSLQYLWTLISPRPLTSGCHLVSSWLTSLWVNLLLQTSCATNSGPTTSSMFLHLPSPLLSPFTPPPPLSPSRQTSLPPPSPSPTMASRRPLLLLNSWRATVAKWRGQPCFIAFLFR